MRYSLLILLLLLGLSSKGSHIIGGNFEVNQVGPNEFHLKLIVWRDCRPQAVPLSGLYISVFEEVLDTSGNPVWQMVTNNYNSPPVGRKIDLGDECYTPTSLCVEEYIFEDTIALPNKSEGYTIAAQICCRNSVIDNIVNPTGTGMTWWIKIPNPAIINSTPNLGNYPQRGFLCLNDLRKLDLQASEPDGDSLYYRLEDPANGGNATPSPPNPPPYTPITWLPGYSRTNAIPGNPALQINPTTGMLTCNASLLGLYVFGYSVSEYRNGIKISEVRRDMQLQVLPCENNRVPNFVAPQNLTYEAFPKSELCIPVSVLDSNAADSIYLISTFESDSSLGESSKPSPIDKSGFSKVQGTICYTPNCTDFLITQMIEVNLQAISYNCKYTDTISERFVINLESINPDVEDLFPNVFTPNGDGINDYFRLEEPISIPCLSDFEIRIFNRWGALVYEHKGSNFSWDGNYKSREITEGVYYFIISGSYTEEPFTYKNFLTLIR